MWIHKKNPVLEIPESYCTDSSQILKHPPRLFILLPSQRIPKWLERPRQSRIPGTGTIWGLEAEAEYYIDAIQSKICDIPFSYFETDPWIIESDSVSFCHGKEGNYKHSSVAFRVLFAISILTNAIGEKNPKLSEPIFENIHTTNF